MNEIKTASQRLRDYLHQLNPQFNALTIDHVALNIRFLGEEIKELREALASQAQQPSCTYTWNCPRCGSGKCIDESDASQAQQSQWISVDERLPDTKEMIISARKKADGTWGLDLNYWTVSNRFAYKYTHWMPLPPAPEGE